MCGHKPYYTLAATHRVSLFPLLSQDKMSRRRGGREGRRAESGKGLQKKKHQQSQWRAKGHESD